MKVLIIGGMGVIGGAITEAAVKKGLDVYVCSRRALFGKYASLNIVGIQGNWNDDSFAQHVVSEFFDVIVDTQVFTKKQLIRSLRIVNGHCKQYVYISTDSVYVHPASDVKEDDFIDIKKLKWAYGYDKRDAELYLLTHSKDYSFYWTGIRPTVTWGETRLPIGFASKRNTNTLINRLIEGKPVLLFAEENTKHAICHTSIFGTAVVDLFLNENAKGQFYHVSDDKAYTYMEIYKVIEDILGVKGKYIHLSSSVLKKYDKNIYEEMIYDKDPEFTLDNSKIKQQSPNTNYHPDILEILKPTVESLKKSPISDNEYNNLTDLILLKYSNSLSDVREKEIAKKYISNFDSKYEQELKKYDIVTSTNMLLKPFRRILSLSFRIPRKVFRMLMKEDKRYGGKDDYTLDRGRLSKNSGIYSVQIK